MSQVKPIQNELPREEEEPQVKFWESVSFELDYRHLRICRTYSKV